MLRLAIERPAAPAAAWRVDVDHITRIGDEDVGVAEHTLARRARIEDQVRRLGRAAAEDAPGPEAGTVAVAHRNAGVGGEDAELHRGGEPAAPAPGPAGIRLEAIAQELHRHLGLVDLDRGVLEIRTVGARAIGAVAMRHGAAAPDHGIERRDHGAVGAVVGRHDVDDRVRSGRRRRHSVRDGEAEGAEQQAAQAGTGQAAHADRGRKDRIEHGALWHDAGEAPRQPGIEHELWVEGVEDVIDADEEQRVARVAPGRHVEGGGQLRVGAGEIEHRLVARDAQGHDQAARIAVDAVLVGEIGEAVFAIRYAAQNLASLVLGVVEQPGQPPAKRVDAEFLQHRLDLALARIERADKRLQVPEILRGLAYVQHHDAEQPLVQHALVAELHRREADPLLVNLGQRAR